jgi:hypothetical protein
MAFNKVQTNKNLGILLANEVDGNTWASVIVAGFKSLGYNVTFPQQYQPGTEDFTVQTARSWAVDVLRRATNLDDKKTVVDAIKATKLETLYGPIDFTEPVSATGVIRLRMCTRGHHVHPVRERCRRPAASQSHQADRQKEAQVDAQVQTSL